MACCGQNREKAAQSSAPQPTKVSAHPVKAAAPSPSSKPMGVTAKLRYTGMAGVRVQGPASGRIYTFSGAVPEAAVDRRDVEGLMKSGLFRRAV